MKTNCKHCDSTFERKNPRNVFCSRKCITASWYKNNKERKNLQSAKWHSDNPAIRDDKQLRYKYGITLAEYNQMVDAQNNLCKICNKPPSKIKKLCVDHCHKTSKVRGLLCDKCNKGLGSFEDNMLSIKNALAYLEESKR